MVTHALVNRSHIKQNSVPPHEVIYTYVVQSDICILVDIIQMYVYVCIKVRCSTVNIYQEGGNLIWWGYFFFKSYFKLANKEKLL